MTTIAAVKANPVISAREVQARLWLRALTDVMQKAGRVLIDNGTMIVKEVDPNTGDYYDSYLKKAPGWTDGKDVFVNQSVMLPTILADLAAGEHHKITASLKGLIYHEMAHILYTPTWSLVERAAGHERNTMMAFNMLEDQRIERLIVARWPHTRPYFVNLVADFVLAGHAPSGTAHALLYGRDYLGAPLRKAARDNFVTDMGEPNALLVDQIVSAFVKLTFPRHVKQGVVLARELARVLWSKPGAGRDLSGRNSNGHNGVGDHPSEEIGRRTGAADEKKQDEDQVSAGDLDGELEGDAAGATGSESDQEADGSADADDDSLGTGKGQGEGEGTSEDDPTPVDDDKQGGGRRLGGVGDAVQEAAEQLRDDLESDAAFQEDLRTTMGNVRQQMRSGGFRPNLPADSGAGSTYYDAAGNPAVASQHTQRVIRELQDFVAPGWDRNMDSGRLNPDAYLRRQPGSVDFFDQWNPGREHDASCEIVVLIDMSGSMDPMTEASQAMWVIKASSDRLRIPCTVIGFNDEGRYIYKRDQQTNRAKYRNLRAHGGTSPQTSLDEAIMLLTTSTAKTKLLFVITDGEWSEPKGATERVNILNGVGVVTSYIGIGGMGRMHGLRNHWYDMVTHACISNPREVVAIVRTTVKAAIARRLMG